jgi:hypothetical protein
MESRLSRSPLHELFLFHDGILAIKEPFTRTFSFSWWNSCYQEAFHTNFLFFAMEFWLSGSLSYKRFLFHDGILAIKKPFTRTFSFSRWNSRYQGAFHTNIFFFTMEFWLSSSLSHELFLFRDGNHRMHDLGEDSFHIYITKSIYIGSASLKTLPLDLEPLCKEKSTVLPNVMLLRKRKLMFFPEITYRHVIRLFCFPKM